MMKKIWLLSIVFIIGINSVCGQVVRYSNDFLTIGVNARNISLGNSTVANVNDLSSAYYNPAGLNDLQTKYEASIMHSEYFAGIAKYDYAGFSYKLTDSIGLGISLIRLGIDDIQNTLYIYDENGNIDYDRIELFSVADYALFASFGKKTNIKGLSYGASAKIIYRNMGKFANAWGFGIDIGAKYSLNKWNFGANLTNATSSFTAWFYNLDQEMVEIFEETGNEIPTNSLEVTMPILNTGVGRYFQFSDKVGMNCELDLNFTFDGKRNALISFNPVSIYPQTGIEVDYKKTLFIRTGVNNFQLIPDFLNTDEENYYNENSLNFVPSIGIGIAFKGLYFDYAYTDVANQSVALYSNIFSISFRF